MSGTVFRIFFVFFYWSCCQRKQLHRPLWKIVNSLRPLCYFFLDLQSRKKITKTSGQLYNCPKEDKKKNKRQGYISQFLSKTRVFLCLLQQFAICLSRSDMIPNGNGFQRTKTPEWWMDGTGSFFRSKKNLNWQFVSFLLHSEKWSFALKN